MSSSESWIAMISALTADGELVGARLALELWRNENPEDEQVNLYDAALAYRMGDFELAQNAVDRYLNDVPEDLRGLVLKYILLTKMNKDGAKDAFLKALNIAENQSILWYELGELLLTVSDTKAAIAAYRKAIAINPERIISWSGIGLAYMRDKQYEKAKDAFSRAGKLTDSLENIVRFGTLELFLGNTDKALDIFKSNIETQKTNPIFWINFGLANYIKNDYDNAEICWQKVLELNPHFPYAHYDIACICVSRGDFENAINHLREAIKFGDYFRNVAKKDGDFQPLFSDSEFGEKAKKLLSE